MNTDKKDDKHRYKYQELTGAILNFAKPRLEYYRIVV